MFDIVACELPGVLELRPVVRGDRRGRLVKTIHAGFFAEHGMATSYSEQYFSESVQGVVRGLHFQSPPHDHHKLVTCLDGEVIDVVVDLRKSSRTYGRHACFRLDGRRANQVYIPTGFAHGFCALSSKATLLYNVGTVYAPSHDGGIRWNSAGIEWPVDDPVVSDRDAALPTLAEFASPF